MSYIALYRKWRPLVFEDVVEQEHVVKTLKNSITTQRIAHAYLFCGTRGTGKTTMAKIFARAINCSEPQDGDPCNQCEICRGILSGNILDVVEIDAASNNSVDNVREIRDEVIYVPSQAKYKVYIIDEVHMLSTGAFNALLKTLEEPPSHVVFILATTEPHKLPATILSRCQRFDFKRISIDSIVDRINEISGASNVSLHAEAARLIARMADGALRDAISILDQCISLGNNEISYDDVLSVVGIVNDGFVGDIVDCVGKKDISSLLEYVDRLVVDGKDITQFISDMTLYYRNLLICKVSNNPGEIIDVSTELIERMKQQSGSLTQNEITCIVKELSALESSMKWTAHQRVLLEVALIKLCETDMALDHDDIAGRLNALERKLANGEYKSKPVPENTLKDAAKSQVDKEIKTVKKPVQSSELLQGGTVIKGKGLQNWNEVLADLKGSGRVVLYTNLFGTKAVEIDEKFVGIVFPTGAGFNKMLVSKAENMEIVENVLAKKLGREVRIKCLDEEDVRQARNVKAGEEKDDFLEKAKDMASRLDVPLNIIDE